MAVSEASRGWNLWRSRRWRRRRWLAWASSAAAFALVIGVMAWGGFKVFNVGEKGEALSVKLGNPDGENLPISVTSAPDQVMQAVLSAQRETAKSRNELTRVSAPEVAPAAAGSVPTKPAAPPPAQTAPSPSDAPKAPTEKVIRGVEKGNSSELVLKPQGDKISQSSWVPAYLYMPLPSRLETRLLLRVPSTKPQPDGKILNSAAERQATLLTVYRRQGDVLVLDAQPPLGERPAYWSILEDAGYDLENAEYKTKSQLRTVVVLFKIGTPVANASYGPLSEVRIEQSSGDAGVDESVKFAFELSGFANGTGQVAQGRYTYDFSGKK